MHLNENIKIRINRYFDGELSREEEMPLFTELSADAEARDYFKQMNVLRSGMTFSIEEYPENLDAKILTAAAENRTERRKFIYSFSAAQIFYYSLTLILLAAAAFLYSYSRNLEEKFETANLQIRQQSRVIELIFNSLPAAKVESSIDGQIIINSNL